MVKRFKPLLGVVMVIIFFLSCTGCQVTGTKAEKPEVINVSYSYRPLNLPTITAHEKKIFEEEFAKDGIEVKWFELEGPATTEALAAKSIDIATSLNYVSAIIAKANGNDIKIISSYSKFPKAIGIVAGVDSGVFSVADLKGKRVALQKGTMLQEMVIRALEQENLAAGDIEIVGMPSPDAINALLQQQVDAAVLPDPLMTKAIASKKAKLIRNAEGLILGQAVIAARTDFLQKYPDVAERFLEIHSQTLTWAENNCEEALDMTSKTIEMDIKVVKALYPKFDFKMNLDENNQAQFLDTAEFLKSNGFIKSEVKTDSLIKDLIDTRFLKK